MQPGSQEEWWGVDLKWVGQSVPEPVMTTDSGAPSA